MMNDELGMMNKKKTATDRHSTFRIPYSSFHFTWTWTTDEVAAWFKKLIKKIKSRRSK